SGPVPGPSDQRGGHDVGGVYHARSRRVLRHRERAGGYLAGHRRCTSAAEMTTSATSPPAFADAGYAARLPRVRTELAAHAIDLLLVTSPANLHYLTGYEASWYPPRLPVAVAVWADRDDTLFFDWVRHRDHVEHTTICDEAVYFEYGEYA